MVVSCSPIGGVLSWSWYPFWQVRETAFDNRYPIWGGVIPEQSYPIPLQQSPVLHHTLPDPYSSPKGCDRKLRCSGRDPYIIHRSNIATCKWRFFFIWYTKSRMFQMVAKWIFLLRSPVWLFPPKRIRPGDFSTNAPLPPNMFK